MMMISNENKEFDRFLVELNDGTEFIFHNGLLLRHFEYVGDSLKCFCPLTYVVYKRTKKVFGVGDFSEAGATIGLDHHISAAIAYSADGTSISPYYDRELRAKLLESTGLKDSAGNMIPQPQIDDLGDVLELLDQQ